jgi:hypothetical protein
LRLDRSDTDHQNDKLLFAVSFHGIKRVKELNQENVVTVVKVRYHIRQLLSWKRLYIAAVLNLKVFIKEWLLYDLSDFCTKLKITSHFFFNCCLKYAYTLLKYIQSKNVHNNIDSGNILIVCCIYVLFS